MGKKIAMTILGVVVGTIGGMILMMVCHFATMPIYPPPEGVDMWNPEHEEQVIAWMGTLPATAWVLAVLCHWIGAAGGAVIAMLVTRRRWLLPAIVTGVIFTIAGVGNGMSLPHPGWFPFVDYPGYLVVAFLAGKWLLRAPEPGA